MDTRKEAILSYLSKNGPTGVNELAREIDINVSTLQKYLHNQNYFKLNENKKWDLPENVAADIKTTTLELMANGVENNILLLQSQLEEMRLSLENSLTPIKTLKRGLSNIIAPVATKSTDIHPRLLKLHNDMINTKKVIDAHLKNVPEEYKDLIKNVDMHELVVDMGVKYINAEFNTELVSILTNNADTLSDDVVQVLKTYQKGE